MNREEFNNNLELYHHGIKGQKWGVRRYQNPDGSLTAAGKERYGDNRKTINLKDAKKEYYKFSDDKEMHDFYEKNNMSSENDNLKYSDFKNIKEFSEKMNKNLKPYLDELSNAEYGSDEWFGIRDAYYDKMDSYSAQYVNAVLKDMNVKFNDVKDSKEFGKWLGIGEGYINTHSDYRSITDPLTGDRDYDLKPSKEYSSKRSDILKDRKIKELGFKGSEAKKVKKEINDAENEYNKSVEEDQKLYKDWYNRKISYEEYNKNKKSDKARDNFIKVKSKYGLGYWDSWG